MATAKERKQLLEFSNFKINIVLDAESAPKEVIEHAAQIILKEDHVGWFHEATKGIYSIYCCACQTWHEVDCRPAHNVRTYTPQNKPMHLEKRECPNCKNEIQLRKKERAKGSCYWRANRFCYFQKFGNFIIARLFDNSRWYKDSKYVITVEKNLFEYARIIFRPEGTRQYNKTWRDSDWSQRTIGTYLGDYNGFQKEQELQPVFAGTFLSNTAWLNSTYSSPISLYKFATWPALEYLYKLGYKALANEIIYGRTAEDRALNLYKNKANEVLGVPHSILQKYDHANLRECDIKAIKQLIAFGRLGQLTPERMKFISKVIETKNSLGSLDIFRDFGIEKVINYLDKQTAIENAKLQDLLQKASANQGCHAAYNVGPSRKKREQVWKDFVDYRSECHTLGYDLTDEGVMFPRDMYAAHARTSELAGKKISQERDAAYFEKYLKVIKPYLNKSFSDEKYLVRIAQTPYEFEHDGNALKLCLWSNRYDQRVVAKTSLIFFIRRAAEPDKPYCALELNYNTKKIVQCRIFGNVNAPPKVYQFVEQALEQLKIKKAAS